jgi:hypothetical protein
MIEGIFPASGGRTVRGVTWGGPAARSLRLVLRPEVGRRGEEERLQLAAIFVSDVLESKSLGYSPARNLP